MEHLVSPIQRLIVPAIVALGLSAICLVALAGYLSADPGLSFFYLLPVALLAWLVGWRAGVLAAAGSAVAWLATDLLTGYSDGSLLAPYLNALLRCGIFLLVAFILATTKKMLERERELARTDVLTGIANARMFSELAKTEIDRARRYKHPFSVAYIDIDDFKVINDRFGHHTGDSVLRAIARGIRGNLRVVDVSARLGGDEFAVLLPETGAEAATHALGKLRLRLLQLMEENRWPLTLSVGAVTFNRPPASVDDMLRRADTLMYAVKRQGKNSITYASWPGEAALLAGAAEEGQRHRALIQATPVEAEHRRRWLVFWTPSPIPVAWRSRKLALVALATLAILIFAAFQALAASLPDSPLYPIKREVESVQLRAARDAASKARVHLAVADQRLKETAALLEVGRGELAAQTAQAYDEEVEATLASIQSESSAVSWVLLQQVTERLVDQQQILRQLESRAMGAERDLVQRHLAKNEDALRRLELAAVALLLFRGSPTPTETQRSAASPLATGTAVAIAIATAAPVFTPSTTPAPFPAAVPSPLALGTPSVTPTQSPPASDTAAPTATPSPTPSTPPPASPTEQPDSQATPTPSPTATDAPTATPTATEVSKPMPTPTQTPTPTRGPLPTDTPTPVPTPTLAKLPPPPCRLWLEAPGLVGLAKNNARETWKAAGFIGQFDGWNGEPNRIVVAQDPPAGTMASACSRVVVR